MTYTITSVGYDFELFGHEYLWLGEALLVIADLEGLTRWTHCWGQSESYILALLKENGLEINLLEEDGSRMDW